MDIEALKAKLDARAVSTRNQGGTQVPYIEAWWAIAEANRIFGHDGWTRETVDLRCVVERERLIGKAQKPGWTVTYIAKVRVHAGEIVREGSGAGHGIGIDLGECHESALKEAESDAMKRALMTFGNPFGLALYDKERREVDFHREPQSAPQTGGREKPQADTGKTEKAAPAPAQALRDGARLLYQEMAALDHSDRPAFLESNVDLMTRIRAELPEAADHIDRLMQEAA